MERAELTVTGMTCGHCVSTVTKALKAVPGVKAAEVSLDKGLAKVTYDGAQAALDDLKRAVRESGYETP